MKKRSMLAVTFLTTALVSGVAQANINQSLDQVCQSVKHELALNAKSQGQQINRKQSLLSRSFAQLSCNGKTLVTARQLNGEKSDTGKSASVRTFLR